MKRMITLLLTILLLTIAFTACSQAVTFEDLTPAQLLDLGERFLLEGNYEQAVIHFSRLIEIEPMNSRGYIGLARAYLGLGNPGRAREVLEQGPEDSEIRGMLDEMDEAEREAFEPAARRILDELAELDEDALREKLETGDLADIVDELSQITDFPMIFEAERGDFGIHRFGSMIYIGEFSSGLRDGFGRWFSLDFPYFSEGQWSDDAPNGQFYVSQHGRATTGSVVNGLWHGPVVWLLPHGSSTPRFEMGRVVVIEADGYVGDGFHPVYRYSEHQWSVFSDEQVNALWGIMGFAEFIL